MTKKIFLFLARFAFQTSCVELLSFLDHKHNSQREWNCFDFFSVPLISRGLKDFDSTPPKITRPWRWRKTKDRGGKNCKLEWFSIQFEEIVMSHREKLSSIITFLYIFMVFVNFTQYRRESCAIERESSDFNEKFTCHQDQRIMHSISHDSVKLQFQFTSHNNFCSGPFTN